MHAYVLTTVAQSGLSDVETAVVSLLVAVLFLALAFTALRPLLEAMV